MNQQLETQGSYYNFYQKNVDIELQEIDDYKYQKIKNEPIGDEILDGERMRQTIMIQSYKSNPMEQEIQKNTKEWTFKKMRNEKDTLLAKMSVGTQQEQIKLIKTHRGGKQSSEDHQDKDNYDDLLHYYEFHKPEEYQKLAQFDEDEFPPNRFYEISTLLVTEEKEQVLPQGYASRIWMDFHRIMGQLLIGPLDIIFEMLHSSSRQNIRASTIGFIVRFIIWYAGFGFWVFYHYIWPIWFPGHKCQYEGFLVLIPTLLGLSSTILVETGKVTGVLFKPDQHDYYKFAKYMKKRQIEQNLDPNTFYFETLHPEKPVVNCKNLTFSVNVLTCKFLCTFLSMWGLQLFAFYKMDCQGFPKRSFLAMWKNWSQLEFWAYWTGQSSVWINLAVISSYFLWNIWFLIGLDKYLSTLIDIQNYEYNSQSDQYFQEVKAGLNLLNQNNLVMVNLLRKIAFDLSNKVAMVFQFRLLVTVFFFFIAEFYLYGIYILNDAGYKQIVSMSLSKEQFNVFYEIFLCCFLAIYVILYIIQLLIIVKINYFYKKQQKKFRENLNILQRLYANRNIYFDQGAYSKNQENSFHHAIMIQPQDQPKEKYDEKDIGKQMLIKGENQTVAKTPEFIRKLNLFRKWEERNKSMIKNLHTFNQKNYYGLLSDSNNLVFGYYIYQLKKMFNNDLTQIKPFLQELINDFNNEIADLKFDQTQYQLYFMGFIQINTGTVATLVTIILALSWGRFKSYIYKGVEVLFAWVKSLSKT